MANKRKTLLQTGQKYWIKKEWRVRMEDGRKKKEM